MITITVTGESLGEVADKLLAIGGSLAAGRNPIMPEVAATVTGDVQTQPKRKKADKEPIVGEKTPEAEPEVAAEPAPEEAPAEEPTKLDFDKDVSPAVTGAVARIGKPAVIAIIEQFGAAKASQIEEARWPELLEALAA